MEQADLSQCKDLVWLQTAFLGDVVLTSAAMNLVAKTAPHIKQHLITTPGCAPLFKDQAFLKSVVTFDKRGRSFLAAAKSCKADLFQQLQDPKKTILLQAHRSVRSSLLSFYLGLPRITYHETALGFGARHKVARISVLHEVSRIGMLLEPLGLKREDIVALRPSLKPPTSLTERVGAMCEPFFAQHERIFALAPGSAWFTKRLPAKQFATLIEAVFKSNQTAAFILLGAKDEIPLSNEVLQALGEIDKTRVLNVTGITSLTDTLHLLSRCRAFIGNDSALQQFASALDLPSVIFFGPTIPAMGFSSLSSRHLIVEHEKLDCRPCSAHGGPQCPQGHFRCMLELSASHERVVAFLKATPTQPLFSRA